MYLTRVLEGVGPDADLATMNIWASRMVEVVIVLCPEDGEQYAQGIKEILRKLDESLTRPRVLQGAVEKVLEHLRSCKHILSQ